MLLTGHMGAKKPIKFYHMFSFKPNFGYIVKHDDPSYNNWCFTVTSRNGKYIGLQADNGEVRTFAAQVTRDAAGRTYEYITIEIGDAVIYLSALDQANNSGSRFGI